MTDNAVHVKDSATQALPLCHFDAHDDPMAWTTRTSARAMATCPECLREVLQDACSVCGGRGEFGRCECCGPDTCPHCDIEAAETIIETRGRIEAKK